jgi:hypothetical protein
VSISLTLKKFIWLKEPPKITMHEAMVAELGLLEDIPSYPTFNLAKAFLTFKDTKRMSLGLL